jgi:hypothetical protein
MPGGLPLARESTSPRDTTGVGDPVAEEPGDGATMTLTLMRLLFVLKRFND